MCCSWCLAVLADYIMKMRLARCTPSNVPAYSPDFRWVRIVSVYDGDTVTVIGSHGNTLAKYKLRLAGIDAPELKGETKEAAILSRDALRGLVMDRVVRVRTHGLEKYGRVLADLYIGTVHVNKHLIEQGFAVAYDGGKKQTASIR